MLKRRFSKKEIEPGALPLFLAFLNEPKTRVPYPSAPFGEWAAIMRAIPRIKLLLRLIKKSSNQHSAFGNQLRWKPTHSCVGEAFKPRKRAPSSFSPALAAVFQIGKPGLKPKNYYAIASLQL